MYSVTREKKANYIKLNTAHRASGSSHDCVIRLTGFQINPGTYSLYESMMPNSFYNVNSSNNQVYFYLNGNAKVATITPGFYTSFDTLATEVCTQMLAVDPVEPGVTLTAAYSATTGYYTFTCVGATSIYFRWASGTANSARGLLGFSATDGTHNLVQTSDQLANLSPVMSYNINVGDVRGLSLSNGNASTFSCPIDTISGGISNWRCDGYNKQLVKFPYPITNLKLQVTDDNGTALNLNGIDYYIILREEKE